MSGRFPEETAHLCSSSREGDGPGEIRGPSRLLLLPNGILDMLQTFPGKMLKLTLTGDLSGSAMIGADDKPGLLTGFRGETAEMVLAARLATEAPADVSFAIPRGGRQSVTKQAVPYRLLQQIVGEKSGLNEGGFL